ncbi:hypothetical protein Tco_1320946 [Tanacetum coccineum]
MYLGSSPIDPGLDVALCGPDSQVQTLPSTANWDDPILHLRTGRYIERDAVDLTEAIFEEHFILSQHTSTASVSFMDSETYVNMERQWRLSPPLQASCELGSAGPSILTGDVLNYAFLASRLQSASLQTKLFRHSGIVASGTTFDDALCVFNTKMKTDLLSNLSEIAAPKLMKKLTDIYFTRVTQTAEFNFSLSSRQMALWCPPIFCFEAVLSLLQSLYGGYLWRQRCIMCRSSPLTQTGMVDFVPGRAVIDAAHRKRVKYEAKCANIEYGFLPFSFSSLGELEKDAVTLLKRIQKFSVTQDIGARAAIHIFNRISFAIAKGVGAQLYATKCVDKRYKFIPFVFSTFEEFDKDALETLSRIMSLSISHSSNALDTLSRIRSLSLSKLFI